MSHGFVDWEVLCYRVCVADGLCKSFSEPVHPLVGLMCENYDSLIMSSTNRTGKRKSRLTYASWIGETKPREEILLNSERKK